ncbi:hypothetical protein MTR_1g068925 [Medicago truncatula]|uniref:Uncharacterized protein n=1 Tax=Medicago truncatula TaxID=3880 RepID=A0A072VWF4_MEDTR|nr:hypothetical protein MTR_1g068925 [Medicago truncatula]
MEREQHSSLRTVFHIEDSWVLSFDISCSLRRNHGEKPDLALITCNVGFGINITSDKHAWIISVTDYVGFLEC